MACTTTSTSTSTTAISSACNGIAARFESSSSSSSTSTSTSNSSTGTVVLLSEFGVGEDVVGPSDLEAICLDGTDNVRIARRGLALGGRGIGTIQFHYGIISVRSSMSGTFVEYTLCLVGAFDGGEGGAGVDAQILVVVVGSVDDGGWADGGDRRNSSRGSAGSRRGDAGLLGLELRIVSIDIVKFPLETPQGLFVAFFAIFQTGRLTRWVGILTRGWVPAMTCSEKATIRSYSAISASSAGVRGVGAVLEGSMVLRC